MLSYPWYRYSQRLVKKILSPLFAGFFTKEEAQEKKMFLAIGTEGSIEEGNLVQLYWLVDPEDGVICDAKFQVYGQSALIGAAEAACEVVLRKNYEQAKRITADFMDHHLRDQPDLPSFTPETYPHLNLVIDAIDKAAKECEPIPLAPTYTAPPVSIGSIEVVEGGYPGWDLLDQDKRIEVLEQVLDHDIRPYIALDEGGVDILELPTPYKVIIGYQGNCTSCLSAVGATLSYIQQVIRNKVHPEMVVEPSMNNFHYTGR